MARQPTGDVLVAQRSEANAASVDASGVSRSPTCGELYLERQPKQYTRLNQRRVAQRSQRLPHAVTCTWLTGLRQIGYVVDRLR